MRFKIRDKVYTAMSLDDIELGDVVLFNTHAQADGLPLVWSDLERAGREIEVLPDDEVERHPLYPLTLGAAVWLSMRAAGEDVTFAQALKVKVSEIDIVPEPEDRKPGKPKGPKKARKASSPADDPAPKSTTAEIPTESA